MRELRKSRKMDHVGYDIRGPIAAEADRMIAAGIPVLKLNTGNPPAFDFAVPDDVVAALRDQVATAEPYSDSLGLLATREAIADYHAGKGIEGVTPDDVFTGNGVSELISMTMTALFDPGDEILIPTPDYPLWTSSAILGGGTVRHYVCDETNEWLPDLDDIRAKVSPRTKAILVINPNNPTGALYPDETLQGIVDIAREHELMIFADEIYDRVIFDDAEHTSIASLAPDLFCITLNGLSKSHMAAGFRCGWMVLSGPRGHARDYIDGLRMLASMRLCSNALAQSVVPAALANPHSAQPLLNAGGALHQRRDAVVQAIKAVPGLSAVTPKAALYLFPKIDRDFYAIDDDEQFCLDYLREKHVLLTHGRGYYWPDPDHFRIVFLPTVEELRGLGESLADFLAGRRR